MSALRIYEKEIAMSAPVARTGSPIRSLAVPTLAVLLLVAGVAGTASAKDLGVRGETWPVIEQDLLALIGTRLQAMQASGEWARLETQARERARARLEEPNPVPGLVPARESRSWFFDPAIRAARDIRTADGQLITAAGTTVDPLTHRPLSRDLLFIDGRRPAEVSWALGFERPAVIVLLAGRPLDLARQHGRPVFFDQGGRLAARFGLSVTPVRIRQEGVQLRISEIALTDDGVGDPERKETP